MYFRTNHEGADHMPKVLLSVKLKNEISRIQSTKLEFHLKNIIINGQKRGCSGFVQNMENGNIVYVNTEKAGYSPLSKKNLYRTAEHLKDYTGGYNQFAIDEEIASCIVNLLNK